MSEIDGQDVLDFILDEYDILDFINLTTGVLEMDEENCCETWEIRKEKSWSIDITYFYKDRGGDEPFPDSPRWDCNSVQWTFYGDDNKFMKWLEKNWDSDVFGNNWKEVYEEYKNM
jgi:hypothetical protein